MKGLWQKLKEIWWYFWEVDVNDNVDEHLSSSDKRWLLYWNFMTCMGVVILFLIMTGISNIHATRQNGRDVEEAMSMIATYMATATRDEYDDIAQAIRHRYFLYVPIRDSSIPWICMIRGKARTAVAEEEPS